MLAEPVVASIGYDDSGLFGFNGRVGKILRRSSHLSVGRPTPRSVPSRTHRRIAQGAFRDGLEQRGFADVGQADLVHAPTSSVISIETNKPGGEEMRRGGVRCHSLSCCLVVPAISSPP